MYVGVRDDKKGMLAPKEWVTWDVWECHMQSLTLLRTHSQLQLHFLQKKPEQGSSLSQLHIWTIELSLALSMFVFFNLFSPQLCAWQHECGTRPYACPAVIFNYHFFLLITFLLLAMNLALLLDCQYTECSGVNWGFQCNSSLTKY